MSTKDESNHSVENVELGKGKINGGTELESIQQSQSTSDFDLIRSKSSDVILTPEDDDVTSEEKKSEFYGVTESPPPATSILLAFQVNSHL